MKKYLLLIAFVMSCTVHAQTFYNIKKNKNCDLSHKCKLKFAYNNDNKSYTYKTIDIGLAEVSRHSDKSLEASLVKVVDKDKNVVIAAVFTGKVKDCTDKNSYASLLLKDGNRVKLMSLSFTKDCHSNYMIVNLTDEDFALLTTSGITKVRLHYVNNEEDFDIDPIGQIAFLESLKCIETVVN